VCTRADGIMTTAVSLSRQVMYRERAAGMYDELPFAVAQCLVELPYNLIQAFLFALISYWMLGFENDAGARVGLPLHLAKTIPAEITLSNRPLSGTGDTECVALEHDGHESA